MTSPSDSTGPDLLARRTSPPVIGTWNLPHRLWQGLLVIAWATPINFAVLPGWAQLCYLAVLGIASISMVGWIVKSPRMLWIAAAVLMLSALHLISGSFSVASPLMLAQILTGAALFRSFKNPCLFAVVWLVVSTAVLVIEQWTRTALVLDLFPGTYFELPSMLGSFRSRGFLGQPVPAGLVPVALLGFVYVSAGYYFRSARKASVVIALSILCVSVSTVVTGTRSVIAALVLLVVGIVALRVVHRHDPPMWALGSVGVVGVAIVAAVAVYAASMIEGLRILDFTNLEGTDSYLVRASAWDVVTGLSRDCMSCVVVGNGHGDLANRLVGGAAVADVSTVDNQWLTVWWDYGVAGLVLLLVLLWLAARGALSRAAAVPVRAGSFGLGILVAVGFFYVPFYLASGAMCLGFMLAASTENSR